MAALNFQEMIAALERYWVEYGCVVMQPYHTEVGAGTFNPATALRCLGPRSPGRRPTSSPRSGRPTGATARIRSASSITSSTRLSSSPPRTTCSTSTSLRSRRSASTCAAHDLRLVEDDWEGPTLGAWGLGWEVWIDGMEVTAVHVLPAARRTRSRARSRPRSPTGSSGWPCSSRGSGRPSSSSGPRG